MNRNISAGLSRKLDVSARVAVSCTLCALCSISHATTLTFEDLPDANFFSSSGQNIGSNYSGVTFGPDVTGLSVTRFGGYADAAHPTHSGDVVVFSAFDTDINISFASALSMVGFWYTSFDPVSLLAYDSANVLLGSVTGAPNTDGFTGASSFLSLAAGGIASVTISSTPGLFVLDDLTYQPAVAVAEPGGLLLLAAACWLVRRPGRSPCGLHRFILATSEYGRCHPRHGTSDER